MNSLQLWLLLSAALFSVGLYGLLTRRHAIAMLLSMELMLNAVNLTFVSLGDELGDLGGQLSVFFVLVVAAAEVVIGLAIVVAITRRRMGATADDLSVLEG